jgi:hypothetical protein
MSEYDLWTPPHSTPTLPSPQLPKTNFLFVPWRDRHDRVPKRDASISSLLALARFSILVFLFRAFCPAYFFRMLRLQRRSVL